jgi:protein-S-isoprenylcysteine O-methyltransferase Ste14
MPIVALALYALYLALAFGLRAALHYRETGTSGIVGVSGRPLSIEWCAGVLFVVSGIGIGLVAPAAELGGYVHAWVGAATWLAHVVGIALTTLGIAGTLWAQLAMGRSWRVGVNASEHTALVSHGPFRMVRNPIYTWMIVVSVGFLLLVPNAIAAVSFVALLVALELQVRVVEEPYLLRAHGEKYRHYAAATGRFLPGVGRFS